MARGDRALDDLRDASTRLVQAANNIQPGVVALIGAPAMTDLLVNIAIEDHGESTDPDRIGFKATTRMSGLLRTMNDAIAALAAAHTNMAALSPIEETLDRGAA